MKQLLLGIILSASISCVNAQVISGIVNRYYKIAAINGDSGWAKIANMDANLLNYNKGLLIQMKGVSANLSSNDASFGDIDSINNAGHFEITKLCGYVNDTVYFERKLNNTYTSGEAIQLVAIPEYSNITVTDTLKAKPWNAADGTGGIIALDVSDTLFLDKPITAAGAGFAGGGLETFPDCTFILSPVTDYFMAFSTSTATNKQGARKGEGVADFVTGRDCGRGKQVSGGGGGNNHNGGGGGGSNYGAGGLGGSRTTGSGNCRSVNGKGIGGLALSAIYDSSSTRLFLGGGGGAGHGNQNSTFGNTAKPGGNGGGIVFINAKVIVNNGGSINADGRSPFGNPVNGNYYDADSDGGGGGGAGGCILVNCSDFPTAISLSSKGAKGSNAGIGFSTNFCDAPGGGGGGGMIKLSTAVTPAVVTTDVSAGATGIVVNINSPACYNTGNGATAGTSGNVLYNYVVPALRDSTPVCMQILPVKLLLDFKGKLLQNKILLETVVSDADKVGNVLLQRSFDGRHFSTINTKDNNSQTSYNFQDDYLHRAVFYRSVVKSKTNSVYTSTIVRFAALANSNYVQVFPNPLMDDQLHCQLSVNTAQFIQLQINDASGKILLQKKTFASKGISSYHYQLPVLAKGIYYASFTGDNFSAVRQLIKTN